jgi:exodeoxyribonuclease V alpha subunit
MIDKTFSNLIYIERITRIQETTLKIQGVYKKKSILSVVDEKRYPWLVENATYMVYGFYKKQDTDLVIENIIPYFSKKAMPVFLAFLEKIKLPSLTKTKIKTLYTYFKEELYTIFFEKKWHLLEKQYSQNKINIDAISSHWEKTSAYILLQVQLLNKGIPFHIIKKLYTAYGSDINRQLEHNPYTIVNTIGFGFLTADRIAHAYGITDDNPLRIASAIEFILTENESNGNTCISYEKLYSNLHKLLKKDYDIKIIKAQCQLLFKNETIVIYKESYIGKRTTYDKEKAIYTFFMAKADKTAIQIASIKSDSNLSLEQKNAINIALHNQFSIITGQAGTGKSRVIKEIFNYNKDKNILILTPTGRAAERLKEIDNNIQATTIHKALHSNLTPSSTHIIIEEASMVDSNIFALLLQTISPRTNITLVGDPDQLPPIGIGSVFTDLIEKSNIPTGKLQKIFRQEGSLAHFAQNIREDKKISFAHTDNEITFIQSTKKSCFTYIAQLIRENLCKEKKHTTAQFITFLNKGLTGTRNLNTFIQKTLQNIRKKKNEHIWETFYLNDKVVITKNNYKKGIRNGELGYIKEYNQKEEVIYIQCIDKTVPFSKQEKDYLSLGYAINIYKSQGSEYNHVIMLIFLEAFFFLNNKSVYTAITRAKKKITILGEKKAFYIGTKTKKKLERMTFLKLFFEDKK